MAWAIPRSTDVTLKEGDRGIVVWSLQKGLNVFQTDIATDGDFGAKTKSAVRAFQKSQKLTVDGIAGPATQKKLGTLVLARYDENVPPRLLEGFAQMEGGWLLGAVNWSVAGGVDCGMLQRRVYDEDYASAAVVERAFNVDYQARLLADRLVELRGIFIARTGTRDVYGGMRPTEKAWRLAALNHNYPSAADRLSRTPIHQLDRYWTSPASWVTTHGFRFPNGTAVRTPLDWCHLYSGILAGKHGHHGNVTKYVSSWS
jgi:hypothetical protein